MYTELVRRLRDSEHEIDCSFCDRDCCYPDGKVHGKCIIIEAADAIEELQKAVYFHKYNSEFWEDKYNSLADEKWIPVTERLPERKLGVLAHVCWPKYEDSAICYGCWDGRNWKLYNYEEGYLIKDFAVTKWMPLPEPPKEE